MTQEEKNLLLKDLSARLPYGVKISIPDLLISSIKNIEVLNEIFKGDDGLYRVNDSGILIEYVKPYLRPMSSMTEEEKGELEYLSEEYFGKALDKQFQESLSSNINEGEILEYIASSVIVDWLNENYFDYRGLIEKGLAIEAPEGMYNF